IAQMYVLREVLLHEGTGRLGEQHLPPVSSAHYACGAMHIQADIALSGPLRLACMQAHAYMHHRAFRKGVGGECALCCHSSRHGITGAGKDCKNGIPLRIDLVPSLPLESTSQQCTV